MRDSAFEVTLAEQSKRMGVPMSAEVLFSVEAYQSPMQFSSLVSRRGPCVGLSSTKNVGYFWLVHVERLAS